MFEILLTRTPVRDKIITERRVSMKKYLGYLIVIIVGVLGFILMIERADQVDNNLAENNNKEEINLLINVLKNSSNIWKEIL